MISFQQEFQNNTEPQDSTMKRTQYNGYFERDENLSYQDTQPQIDDDPQTHSSFPT